jgi:hypothetical protein
MQPDRIFRLLLTLSAAFIAGLFVLALVPSRRRWEIDAGLRPPLPVWVLVAGSVIVLAAVAGPLALVAIPLLVAARRWGRSILSATAFVAFIFAGVAAAWNPAMISTVTAGAFGRPAQIASIVAVAAVLCGLIMDGRIHRRGTFANEGPAEQASDIRRESRERASGQWQE